MNEQITEEMTSSAQSNQAVAPRVKWHLLRNESADDDDDEEEAEDDNDYAQAPGKGGYHSKKSIIVCSATCIGFLLLLLVIAIVRVPVITRSVILDSSRRIFGVDVEVGDVTVGIFNAQSSITDMMIGNPTDYAGNFLELHKVLVDASFWSLFSHRLELEEVRLSDLDIDLQQSDVPFAIPNFVLIVKNIIDARMHPPEHQIPGFLGGKIASRRFTVDRLEIRDLTVHMNMKNLEQSLGLAVIPGSPQINYTINRVQVKNIGKSAGGVHVPELICIIVNAILGAAVEEAPGEVAQGLLAALSTVEGLGALDFESLHLDLGSGLRQIENLLDRLKHGFLTGESAVATPSVTLPPDSIASPAAALDKVLETTAARTQHSGPLGNFVSNALNSTEAWSHRVFGTPTMTPTIESSASRGFDLCASCKQKCHEARRYPNCLERHCAKLCAAASAVVAVTTAPPSIPSAIGAVARGYINQSEASFGRAAHDALEGMAESLKAVPYNFSVVADRG